MNNAFSGRRACLRSLVFASFVAPAYSQDAANPVNDTVKGLGVIADIFSGKIPARYSPLDGETFSELSTDIIGIAAQKPAPLTAAFQRGTLALTFSAERNHLAYSQAWREVAGVNDHAFVAPDVGIHYTITNETVIGITYRPLRSDGTSIAGIVVHHQLRAATMPVQWVASFAYGRLFNGAPLQVSSTSLDTSVRTRNGNFMPYAGIGVVRGSTEFHSDDRMQFSTDMARAYGGFEYRFRRMIFGSELGVSRSQVYHRASATYLF